MDPNHNTTAGVGVPQPQGGAPLNAAVGVPAVGAVPDAQPAPAPQTVPQQPAAPPMPPSAPPPAASAWLPPTVPVQPAAPQAAAVAAPAAPAVPDIAEDADLIEKEWVIKAKHIVEGTRQDPYEQTKQIDKFKAEYMQKRYNKTIGSTDD